MRKSTFLALAAVASIVIPHMAYGAGVNDANAAAPVATPLDRTPLVAEILSTWRAEISARGMDVGAWENDIRQALATRNDGQLLALRKATSYDSLVRQLGGSVAPGMTSVPVAGGKRSSLSSARTPLVVGDSTQDLVYVPITPCRIFDTRFGSGAGKIAAGATKAFYTNSVSAGSTAFLAQGGDASLCTSIPFDPPAVMITLTTVNEEATGFLTAWPYFDPYPSTSHLNWTTNVAIANTTSVLTCYSCGLDINIAVSAKTNVLGDVVGYFEQAVLPPAGRAYAAVSTSVAFVTARTKNFSAVTRPGTGIYCLTPTIDASNVPIFVTTEWGGSVGNDFSATAYYPASNCSAGQIEVLTFNPSGTFSNSTAFNVFIP